MPHMVALQKWIPFWWMLADHFFCMSDESRVIFTGCPGSIFCTVMVWRMEKDYDWLGTLGTIRHERRFKRRWIRK
jgi:hypothetical protein